jgi:hypothetical protein
LPRLLSILVTVVATGYWPGPLLFRKYQVWYHEQQLRLAMGEFREHVAPTTTVIDRLNSLLKIEKPPIWERADIHKQRLVELGGLEFHEFRFMYFDAGTGAKKEGQHFMRSLYGREAPPCVDWISVHPNRPEQLVLRVWCKPGGIASWREFVRKYDVPNYWEIRDESVQLPEPISEEL